jgi:hypothetical protein
VKAASEGMPAVTSASLAYNYAAFQVSQALSPAYFIASAFAKITAAPEASES